MGGLRTILALSVVLSHSYGFAFVGGQVAVQLFYMISGFLISFVLVEARSYGTPTAFYVNRYLRLYPTYAVVALLTLCLLTVIGGPAFWHVYATVPRSAALLLVFSNTFLFGQDWVMFSAVDHGRLTFATDFLKSDPKVYEGLLVPQAWTLGLELTFYLIAPLLVKRRRWIYGALIVSLSLRVWLLHLGLAKQDPWTYRFFPTELAFFLLGSIAHQVLRPAYRRLSPVMLGRSAVLATGFLTICFVLYAIVPLRETIKSLVLFGLFFALMPLAFEFQRTRRLDRYFGDLSFPIYISHVLVLLVIESMTGQYDLHGRLALSLVAIAATLVAAAVLERWVTVPIERLRDRIRSRSEPSGGASPTITMGRSVPSHAVGQGLLGAPDR